MIKIAIDLTWVRPNKVGGTESCVRNLLDGFAETDYPNIIFFLLVSNDNAFSFEKYQFSKCFDLIKCNVNSSSQVERVIWQNFKMGTLLRKRKIFICLEPVYGKPFFNCHDIRFITTIHDLQAKHFPHYFSIGRVLWMKISWKNAVKTSEQIIAISSFVKEDIIKTYKISNDKVSVIFDAIALDMNDCSKTSELRKYSVEPKGYYYTVSSLFLHKNLKTAILAIAELKKRNSIAFKKLVVSGIGGRKRDELDSLINENNLTNDIIFTSFVNDNERNMLYKNCKAFIFTSLFEGFGMPPLEAMAFGAPVLTSKSTSLGEITGNLCNYVTNPLDPIEWADKLESELKSPTKEELTELLKKYDKVAIASEYIKLFENL